MKLEDLVAIISEKAKAPELTLDEGGRCMFSINQRFNLALERSSEPGNFLLYSVVCDVPQYRELEILRAISEGNLFGGGSGSCKLGYDSRSALIILERSFDEATTDADTFFRELRQFMACLSYWTERLGEGVAPAQDVADFQRHVHDFNETRVKVALI